MKNTLNDILEELITEASNGKVVIDKEEWPIAFNTIIYDKEKEINKNIGDINYPTLIIKDKDYFLDLLEDYIKLELKKNRPTPKNYTNKEINHIKRLVAYLLVNASLEDFQNSNQLIEKRISFLEDNHFKKYEKGIKVKAGKKLLDSNLIIKKEVSHTSMETPYKISFTLEKNNCHYNLPDIYYGIYKDTCYIYSIINKKDKNEKTKEENEYIKKINRILYKINNGIKDIERQDYYDYLEGKTLFYPEDNISDVTHSFVISLSIFMILLQKENIQTVKGVPYLPLRYLSREIASKNLTEDKQKELILRNDKIQTNLTNKFIRTFRRVASHNKDIQILRIPFEVDEYLTLNINNKKQNFNNELLNSLTEDVKVR